MQVINLFNCPIVINKLELNSKEIEKECINLNNKSKKIKNRSGVGGDQVDIPKINIIFNKLEKEINLKLKEISINNMELVKETKLSNMWFCINRYKDFNKPHTHPFSILSGVYYVKVPKNSGRIVFKNSNSIDNFLHQDYIKNFNTNNSSEWFMQPEENMLYIFPSWVTHYVEPNLSKKERISIAFNAGFDI